VNLIDKFPENFTPLKQQEELLSRIDAAFDKGKRYVICCAPTGSGKSFLSKTLGNASKTPSQEYKYLIESNEAFAIDQFGEYYRASDCIAEPEFGAFALTITKGLQDQYKETFDDANLLKGKRNYICAVDPRFEVEVAPCVFDSKLKDKCIANSVCPYYNSRKELLVSRFGVLNYSMFLSLPDHVKKREFIICDEASEIEDELIKRFSRSINLKILKKLDIPILGIPISDYTKFHVWLNNLIIKLNTEIDSIKKNLSRKKNDIPVSELQRYSLYNNLFMSLKTTIETWNSCEYLIEKTQNEITLKPLKVDTLSKHIFAYGEKILLMSATIIDHKHFAKTLGIDDYEYIEVDSTFNPKNAPILSTTKVRLNYKNLKEQLPNLKSQVKKICDYHKDVKGIIHTHTMEITEFLKENIKDSRFLFRVPGCNNEQILKQHYESDENTILVSPSLTYGIDLKEDLARFQIIMKAAWLPLGDERIKKLFKDDPVWYLNKMLNNLIQACGRGVRSEKDKCVTYIMDASITDSVLKNKDKLPKYFLKRFV
jgi:ATP-dependent DNA helicase DinG